MINKYKRKHASRALNMHSLSTSSRNLWEIEMHLIYNKYLKDYDKENWIISMLIKVQTYALLNTRQL